MTFAIPRPPAFLTKFEIIYLHAEWLHYTLLTQNLTSAEYWLDDANIHQQYKIATNVYSVGFVKEKNFVWIIEKGATLLHLRLKAVLSQFL